MLGAGIAIGTENGSDFDSDSDNGVSWSFSRIR